MRVLPRQPLSLAFGSTSWRWNAATMSGTSSRSSSFAATSAASPARYATRSPRKRRSSGSAARGSAEASAATRARLSSKVEGRRAAMPTPYRTREAASRRAPLRRSGHGGTVPGMALKPEDLAVAVEHFRAGRVADALAVTGRHEIENALGTDCVKEGDREGAERHYREAIARAPGFFKPHNNLGNVLRERGELEAAVEHYREALRIEPSAQRVHANLGNAFFGLGLHADAIESYRRALALQAGAPVALRLGEALEAIGDTEQALLAYARAVEMGDPAAPTKRERLVVALQRHGPFGRAVMPAPEPEAATDRSGRRPLAGAAGDELAALLAPVSPATFVSEYWGKRPLFVKGFAGKYQGFFDAPAFVEAVANPGRAPAEHLRASFDKKVAPQRPTDAPVSGTHVFNINPDQAAELIEAGATICVTEIESRVPRLAAFLATRSSEQLGYPGRLAFNGYASAPGTGFNWHFDGRIASTLQIEGTKRWRFSRRTAIDWPRGNGVRQTDGSARYSDPSIARGEWERLAPLDEGEVTTVILEPGDLLILPAGVWHEASSGPTASLALNLAFLPFSHMHIVEDLLDGVLANDPAWRATPPVLPTPGRLDPEAIEAVRKQIERAGEALRALAGDRAAIEAVWTSLVQSASASAGTLGKGPR